MIDACDNCKGCPDCGTTLTKRTPEAISLRLSKVSDGPWTAWNRGIGYEVHGPDGEPVNSGHWETFSRGDAEFIANAPADVAYLLALARKQATALEAAEEWMRTLDVVEEFDPTRPGHLNCSAAGLASVVRAAINAALKEQS